MTIIDISFMSSPYSLIMSRESNGSIAPGNGPSTLQAEHERLLGRRDIENYDSFGQHPSGDLKQAASERTKHWRSYLTADIDTRWADLVLILLFYVAGLVSCHPIFRLTSWLNSACSKYIRHPKGFFSSSRRTTLLSSEPKRMLTSAPVLMPAHTMPTNVSFRCRRGTQSLQH